MVHHDHLHKVVVEEMLEIPNEGDVDMEDDAEADGSVVVKEDSSMLHRPELVHSVLAVASMDITHRNVRSEPVDPAVAILPSLSTSAVILRRFVVNVEEQEETAEVVVAGEPVSRV